MKDVKEKISSKALELFNDKGIEYVGMRELAAALDTRIGNITYYFPTKDELVYHLSTTYAQRSTDIRRAHEVNSLHSLLTLFTALFMNQVKYRCLLLSFVHLIEHNALLAQDYKDIRKARSSANEAILRAVVASGHLKANDEQVLTLASGFNLIVRFWLSEAIISGHHRNSLEKRIPSYIRLLANLLKPLATVKGKRDLADFFEEA